MRIIGHSSRVKVYGSLLNIHQVSTQRQELSPPTYSPQRPFTSASTLAESLTSLGICRRSHLMLISCSFTTHPRRARFPSLYATDEPPARESGDPELTAIFHVRRRIPRTHPILTYDRDSNSPPDTCALPIYQHEVNSRAPLPRSGFPTLIQPGWGEHSAAYVPTRVCQKSHHS